MLHTDLNFEQLREFAERVGVSTAGKHSLAGLAGALSVEGFVVERVEAPGYQEAHQKYHKDQGRLHEEFRQDLFDTRRGWSLKGRQGLTPTIEATLTAAIRRSH